jgi:hypothetical protein
MSLGKYIAEIIIEPTPKKVALYPGAFKPPHRGHFELVQRLSKVSDEVLIIISPIAREGITAEQSLKVWKLYLPLLPKAKVVISDKASPISYVYDYVKSNPQQDIEVAYGKGEEDRYKAFLNKEKYPNVKVYDAGNIEGLSASSLRAAIKSFNPVDIAKFLPQGIEVADFMNALNLSLRTEPTFKSVTENTEQLNLEFTKALANLTKYYVDNGYNVKPLPKVKIINNDEVNASNLLGKTAYYDPSNRSITLFTVGRHPKDILRSFSHEMIHHIQNLENRLNNINTTNTTEDDYLSQLEQEAYLNGNMVLRNWEDGIKNPIKEVYQLDSEKFNYPKSIYENLWYTLNEITLNPSNAVEIYGGLTNGKFQVGDIVYIYDIKQVKNPYNDEGNFFNIMFHPENNVTSKPLEGKENYIKILNTMYKVILDFIEEAEPDYVGISSMDNNGSKNYHNVYANLTNNKSNRIPGYFRKDVSLEFNTPEGKGRFVVLKRKNNEVMNEEKEKSKYIIFCDMDGVLVDFDKGYEDLTGLHTKHADVQDSNDFWNKFKSSLAEKNMEEYDYWANLEWMSDGQELWNYIKQYNPYVLTAPSRDPGSKLGKKEWVQRLDNMKNIYFRAAQNKSDFSGRNRILIDDRADTIEKWNKAGGIGILHTSTQDTIEQLKKLGL